MNERPQTMDERDAHASVNLLARVKSHVEEHGCTWEEAVAAIERAEATRAEEIRRERNRAAARRLLASRAVQSGGTTLPWFGWKPPTETRNGGVRPGKMQNALGSFRRTTRNSGKVGDEQREWLSYPRAEADLRERWGIDPKSDDGLLFPSLVRAHETGTRVPAADLLVALCIDYSPMLLASAERLHANHGLAHLDEVGEARAAFDALRDAIADTAEDVYSDTDPDETALYLRVALDYAESAIKHRERR